MKTPWLHYHHYIDEKYVVVKFIYFKLILNEIPFNDHEHLSCPVLVFFIINVECSCCRLLISRYP